MAFDKNIFIICYKTTLKKITKPRDSMQTLYPSACSIANIYGQTVPGQSRCGEHLSPESWNAAHYTCVCCHQTPAPVSPTLSQKVTKTRWQTELGGGTFSVSPTVFLLCLQQLKQRAAPRPAPQFLREGKEYWSHYPVSERLSVF